jgi:A/G-specific adenine glycosylase
MHKAAQAIAFEHKGIFPKKADDLKKLPGIGPYTAGAISSFAFDEKAAVVDGNVQRVLGRFYCVDEIPNSTTGQKIFWNMAHTIMEYVNEPAAFNSALMDLGSEICTTTQPKCSDCPLHESCLAYSVNKTQNYPLKKSKAIVKQRFIHFAFVENQNKIAVQKRLEGDIWAGLFQFPILADHDAPTPLPHEYALCTPLYNCTHKLTHRLLHLEVLQVDISTINLSESVFWIKKEDLKTLGFPRPLKKFIDLYL